MVYFLDSMPTIGNQSKIPSDLHMMQHVYRSKIYEPQVKSIINTNTALTLKQHRHALCLDGVTNTNCLKIDVAPNIAKSHHYRKGCEGQRLCDESQETLVKDTSVWRHLETVIRKTNFAFEKIFYN